MSGTGNKTARKPKAKGNGRGASAARAAAARIHPVILSGGAGSRLWPLSREHYPKQLLALAGDESLLRQTARRVQDAERFAAPRVICNEEHRFVIAEQLREIGATPAAILLEPMGRNTAPAAAVAALHVVAEAGPEALLLLLPSDHLVRDEAAFAAALDVAAKAARGGALVTFGIRPTSPETGYGYIRRGAALKGVPGAFAVASFVEKPDRARAETYLAAGEYDWNSGMFLFQAGRFLAELERLEPQMLKACRAALARSAADLDFCRLEAKAFAAAPARSIDVAVMERTRKAAVVPADLGWSDVGSFSALWEIAAKDAHGNVLLGDVLALDTSASYLRSEGMLTAVVGLDDVLVVTTEDAVLVAAKSKAQEVKALVEKLKAAGREEAYLHSRQHRPWGWHQTIDLGDRFRVKHILVKPGESLSLQKHFHRAEHWVVVYGIAEVTRDQDRLLVRENESIFIPLGAVHRLRNPGKLPLRLIEVQSGSYLGEDDIVRLDDVYGRA